MLTRQFHQFRGAETVSRQPYEEVPRQPPAHPEAEPAPYQRTPAAHTSSDFVERWSERTTTFSDFFVIQAQRDYTVPICLVILTLFVVPPFNDAVRALTTVHWRGQSLLREEPKFVGGKYQFSTDMAAQPELHSFIQGYEVTSGRGNRVHPVTGEERMHQGVDVATPVGTPLKAIALPNEEITVQCLRDPQGYGLYAITSNPSVGWGFLVGHLSTCEEGRFLSGETFAHTGGAEGDPDSGLSTGPHLHFEQLDPTSLDAVDVEVGYLHWILSGKNPPTQEN